MPAPSFDLRQRNSLYRLAELLLRKSQDPDTIRCLQALVRILPYFRHHSERQIECNPELDGVGDYVAGYVAQEPDVTENSVTENQESVTENPRVTRVTKKGRGRPKSDDASSAAERARQYRLRKARSALKG